jgi:radical SAM-linked protein
MHLNSIRIRFTREEDVKFISHLDLMKVFERAVRRSGLPIAYSQGFNPHPHMVFGLPLSVGVTSDGEYADFELTRHIQPQQFMDVLNASLPEAIRITSAGEKLSKTNIMAAIAGADYALSIFSEEAVSLEEAASRLKALMAMDSIKVLKEGKGAAKEVDIRPLIHSTDIAAAGQLPFGYETFASAFVIHTRFSAGSAANLRPELFVKALVEKAGLPVAASRLHRRALYVDNGGILTDPMDKVVLGQA